MRLLIICILALAASTVPAYAGDTEKPSVPNGVSATALSSNSIRITWNKPWDNVGVAGYNIYRNGSYYTTVYGNTNHVDARVSGGNSYEYSVVAFDDARNYTTHSNSVSASTGGGSSTGAAPRANTNGTPTAPDGLRAVAKDNDKAALSWNKPSGDVAGYNIYRNGSYRRTVRSTDYTDSHLSSGQEYRYQVVAFSSQAKYSLKSSEVKMTTGGGGQSNATVADDRSTSSSGSAGAPSGYRLVFSDEFRGNDIDSSKWNTRYRWGPNWIINGEKQYYVDRVNDRNFGHSPFEFDGEHMTITAIHTPGNLKGKANNQPYLSGALTTFGKFKMRYGYVEMRAKMPKGKGLWPAFWLLHQNENGKRPEIDVVELLGQRPNVALHTYHYYDNWKLRSTPTFETPGPNYADGFHTFAVKWEPGKITWLVDGRESKVHSNGNVAGEDMYLLLNLAVGGWWPGNPDGSTQFPARFSIDYIRAYSKN
ncbi:MAG: family 16 glycosylhydrolase [Granulosicoccus sp.]